MGFFDTILFPFIWFDSAILVGFEWLLTRLGLPDTSGWTWVLAIVGLVITLRALLTPLMIRQIKSQRRLQMVQPELAKIQARYKGKKDQASQKAFQEETFALYREAGANPFSACLPILIQMPFFFALFRLLNSAEAVSDGRADPLGLFSFELATKMANSEILGAGLTSTFLHDQDTSAKILSAVLIVVMSATQFITSHQLMRQNMSPEALNSPMAKQQQMLIYILPIVFAVTGVNFPVALLIYWTVSNLWTMGQQFFVIRNMPAPGSPAEKKYRERMARKGRDASGIQLKNPNLLKEREAASAETQQRTGQRTQPKSKKRSKKR
ncbi:membrane protein insertase YidC [Ornithinimicrobium humiphilum]|uniref:Membrane protein insertase YidC n=1 Tax=Ornithinimicrobium humiphilum TaxID=125288 RepID=A0A543KJE5_9MICO|nr:membrane protein insertase YidC [Ornithinimicrobium humiphilum]TQM95202.1 YidC/Oxa1 family membrane protein insertase [Ornithinimicrobium humiphilum]